MKKEIWKDVLGYEGYYQISSYGTLRSLDRFVSTGFKKGKILTQRFNSSGYITGRIMRNNKTKHAFIHRLIAQSFIFNEFHKKEVNHKNGIKTDNRIENLEWCTPSENRKHAYSIGLFSPHTEQHKKNSIAASKRRSIGLVMLGISGKLIRVFRSCGEAGMYFSRKGIYVRKNRIQRMRGTDYIFQRVSDYILN